MKVTFYLRPNGQTREMDITNIQDEDAIWFESNNVTISMEEINDSTYAIYADIGLYEDDEETPREIIHITGPGESCENALSKIRTMCENAINKINS